MNGTLHRTIGEVAAMPLLREMTERALSRWERLRRHYFQGVLVPRVEQAQREHRELLAALVARDADAPSGWSGRTTGTPRRPTPTSSSRTAAATAAPRGARWSVRPAGYSALTIDPCSYILYFP